MQAVLLTTDEKQIDRVFGKAQRERLCALFGAQIGVVHAGELEACSKELRACRYIFSTWGMPQLSKEQIAQYFPQLEAVFYAAGSVRYFAVPFLQAGVRVFSAWQMNAVPVIESAVSQILLANKGFYYLSRICKTDWRTAAGEIDKFKGNYGARVGLLGYGAIGQGVARALAAYDVEILVYSSHVRGEELAPLGAKKSTPEEIFATCDVVSNHMADTPATAGFLSAELFARLRPYTTFLNTGRGAQVDEAALAARLREEPTITAVLDVTSPEPPAQGHPFYALPNVVLTPHSAGSSGMEVRRMADHVISQCAALRSGQPTQGEVSEDMLSSMA